LIVDFGASLNHTHHKESIFAFASLLREQSVEYEIWVPMGSEISNPTSLIKRILLPGTHPIGFNLVRPSTWISAFHGKLNNFANKRNIKYLHKFLILTTIVYFYFLLRTKTNNKPISILFTTACPFSFRLIYLLEKKKINAKIYCRLTNTAEQRGAISKIINYQDLIDQSNEFIYVKLKFGIETEAFLENQLANDTRAFISKFPSKLKVTNKQIVKSKLVISFLGYPTKHKGQNHIVPIIQRVSMYRNDIEWQVQLYQNDPIELELNKITAKITILAGKIAPDIMDKALLRSTLICLPYDVMAFKYNSSAMMYQSSDYLVPIITFTGSAFSSDIRDFRCGISASNEDEVINKLKCIDFEEINDYIDGCRNYNEFRNKSNYIFLDL
jgi:hypothetical protein